MDLWRIYDYLVNVVHKYSIENNQCLYNALVITMGERNQESLILIRNSALALVEMINQEIDEQKIEAKLASEDELASEENDTDE